MTQYHKHKGAEYSDGKLKSHPVDQKHKDKKVQMEHDRAWKPNNYKKVEVAKKVFSEATKKLDDDDCNCCHKEKKYLTIDVNKLQEKGVIIKFTRIEGRVRKQVTLQIDRK